MALWERLRLELDRAGRSAADAIDEGRTRLDLHRARSAADRFAQRLGYAVYHARRDGRELTPEEYEMHAANVRTAEADITRLETLIADAGKRRRGESA
jgi:hypothetical protein